MTTHNTKLMSEKEMEHLQVAVTQGDIRAIKKEVEVVSGKVNDVHQALIGSPLSKDGGMVQRLQECEQNVEELRDKIVAIEMNHEKSALYLKIIWGLGGVVLTALITYFLNK